MYRHSEWRKLAKKLRRKRIRQKLAEERKEIEEQGKHNLVFQSAMLHFLNHRKTQARKLAVLSNKVGRTKDCGRVPTTGRVSFGSRKRSSMETGGK